MSGPIVFRISPLGYVGVITLVVCVTPAAITAPGGVALYLLPLAWFAAILRPRTTVTAETVTARGIVRARRVAWADITALRLRSDRFRSRVSAMLADGTELPLPALHVRDLPLLAEVSGGRLPELASPEE